EPFLARVREIAALTTLVNPAALVAWNIHKGYLLKLGRAGIPIVPLSVVARGAAGADQDAARTAFGDEIVIKPAISGGAFGPGRPPPARDVCAHRPRDDRGRPAAHGGRAHRSRALPAA